MMEDLVSGKEFYASEHSEGRKASINFKHYYSVLLYAITDI